MGFNFHLFALLYGLSHRNPIVDAMISFAADPLGVAAVICIGWFLLTHKEHKHALWELTVCLGVAFLSMGIGALIKHLVPTLRPFIYLGDIDPLVAAAGAAFPSMHTAFYSALGAAMAVAHRRSGIAVIILALVIGLARVASGVHWPIDVLGGLIIGIGFGHTTMRLSYAWLGQKLKIHIL